VALVVLVGQEWVSVELTVLTQAAVAEADRLVGLAVPVLVVQQDQQVIGPVVESQIQAAGVLGTVDTQVTRRMRTARAAMERQAS
tara:strand:+ start:405 stop:659 length:255 start_codon:yes stop_codon:yes gene_type:complete